jgi:hypothetical protein
MLRAIAVAFGTFCALSAMHDNKSTTAAVDLILIILASILFGAAAHN